jgi:hypothetical protein
MKRKTAKKTNPPIDNNYAKTFAALGLLTTVGLLIPESAYAADTNDAFAKVYETLSGWIGGSAGKLITLAAALIAGAMGVLGFSGRAAIGVLGVGLLLSTSTTVVNMIFK